MFLHSGPHPSGERARQAHGRQDAGHVTVSTASAEDLMSERESPLSTESGPELIKEQQIESDDSGIG